MKRILSVLLLFVSVFSFGQNTHIQTIKQTLNNGRTISPGDSINLARDTFQYINNGQVYIGDTLRASRDSIIVMSDSWGVYYISTPTAVAGWNFLWAGYENSNQKNLAVSGATSGTMVSGQLPLVPTYIPAYRYVGILIGTNDITGGVGNLPNYKANLQKTVDTLIARGYPLSTIVIITPGWTSYARYALTRQFADTALSVAAAKGVIGVDVLAAEFSYLPASIVNPDSLHPNTLGFQIISDKIVNSLSYRSGNLVVGGNIGVNTARPLVPVDINGKLRTNDRILADSVFVGMSGNRDSMSTVVGRWALYQATTATSNNAFGLQTLSALTTGTYNSAFGDRSMFTNITGNRNSGFGHYTLYFNTVNDNTAFGYSAGLNVTTGAENTLVGGSAGLSIHGGGDNTAVGFAALLGTNAGALNTGLGAYALNSNVSGGNNAGVGYNAMFNNTASNNTSIGFFSGYYNTSGTLNVFIGATSGYKVAHVDYRSITDNNMTFLGYGASRDTINANTTALTNGTALGYNAVVRQSNQVSLGNALVTSTILHGAVSINLDSGYLGQRGGLLVNRGIWQNKDSLGTAVSPSTNITGIDSVTGKYVRSATVSVPVLVNVTLVTGTKATTVTGLTTSSHGIWQTTSQNTAGATVDYIVVCTANTVTVSAVTVAGNNTVDVANISSGFVIIYP